MFTSHCDGRYRVYRRGGKRFTDQCVYESDRFGGGSAMAWAGICHDGRTQLKIVQGTLNAVKYRDDILDPIALPFLQHRNFDQVFQHDNARCHKTRVYQDFLNQNHIRVLLGRHYHRICHELNIYGMTSEDVFATSKSTGNTTGASWRICARVEQYHTSLYPKIDWFYASEMRSCRYCKRWSHTLLNSANLHTAWQYLSMICSDNDIEKFCWYCLICYAYMNLNYTIFVDLFLYVKNIEHQILVSFLLLTCIYLLSMFCSAWS